MPHDLTTAPTNPTPRWPSGYIEALRKAGAQERTIPFSICQPRTILPCLHSGTCHEPMPLTHNGACYGEARPAVKTPLAVAEPPNNRGAQGTRHLPIRTGV